MINLLFLEKKHDIINTNNNNEIVGGIFIFENLNKEHGEIINDEFIPDLIFVMFINGEIDQILSYKIPNDKIIEYFKTTYTKEQILELNNI